MCAKCGADELGDIPREQGGIQAAGMAFSP